MPSSTELTTQTPPDGDPRVSPPAAPADRTAEGGANRQEALVALGRRALASPDPDMLLRDAASLLAEIFGAPFCGAARVGPDGRSLRFQFVHTDGEAAAGRPRCHEYTTRGDQSLAGYALYVARPVTADDLSREQRFGDAFLQEQGVRSAVAVPLKMPGRAFGALVACSPKPHAFRTGDLPFAETVAHLVGTTLARAEAETSLARERRFATSVIDTVDALVLMLDKRGHVVRINRMCEQVTGFAVLDIQGRPVWTVLSGPDEAGLFQRALDRIAAGEPAVEFESVVLTKRSEKRQIAWTAGAVPDRDGTTSILLTGLDITAQRRAEAAARRAEEATQKARQTVTRLLQGKPVKDFSDTEGEGAAAAPFGRMPVPAGGERRRHPRRAYPYIQKIAPITGAGLPPRASFYEVQCHDIAAGGFSFYADAPLAVDALVVALGTPPKLTYLVAQVAHVTRIERDGRKVFLIGCNYTDRAGY